MNLKEFLDKNLIIESLLEGICFSENCVSLDLFLSPGIYIPSEFQESQKLVLSFHQCLQFSVERKNVGVFEIDQLFVVNEGTKTIISVMEEGSIIPPFWKEKYKNKINGLIIETMDLLIKIVFFQINLVKC